MKLFRPTVIHVSSSEIRALCCDSPGFIGKITLQIPFYRPHSDPWVISMSQLNLIIGPAQLQEYDGEKEKEEERERKTRLLKALEDRFKVGGSTPQIIKLCFLFVQLKFFIHPESLLLCNEYYSLRVMLATHTCDIFKVFEPHVTLHQHRSFS